MPSAEIPKAFYKYGKAEMTTIQVLIIQYRQLHRKLILKLSTLS